MPRKSVKAAEEKAVAGVVAEEAVEAVKEEATAAVEAAEEAAQEEKPVKKTRAPRKSKKAAETEEAAQEEKPVKRTTRRTKKADAEVEAAAEEKKDPAKKAAPKPVESQIVIQYQNNETDFARIEQKIKDQFVAEGHRVSSIKKLNIYVKPEDYSAYYVINEKFSGRVDLF